MPIDRKAQQREEQPLARDGRDGREPEGEIEGKTFEEWEAEYQQITTPYQARELALCRFGVHPDQVVIDVPAEPDSEREA